MTVPPPSSSAANSSEVFLKLISQPAAVVVTRGADVPDVFWLRVWAEWGSAGRNPQLEITVSVEVLLSNLAWFPAACRLHRVAARPDDGVRQVLTSRQAAGRSLALARDATPLTADEVEARLAGGRFTRDLRPFQVRDLGHLLAIPNGANFSVPGAGKTTVTYALYEAERLAGHVERMLVVGPNSSFLAWEEEAVLSFRDRPEVCRFTGLLSPTAEVILVNYQRLSGSYAALASWVSARPTMVVLDEAHRAKKGWAGQWGSSCLSLALLAARRDVLTGTPAPQSSADLAAVIDFLWPGQARSVLPSDALRPVPPADIGPRVAAAIAPLFTRTTKDELDLPRIQYSPVIVPLEGLQRDVYDALRRQFAGPNLTQRERVDYGRMGQIVMYLLEAATNPNLLPVGAASDDPFLHPPLDIPDGSPLSELIANYGQHETPRKFIELLQMVRDNADRDRKTLVWTNFVRNISVLERMLAAFQPAKVHGGVVSDLNPRPGVVSREMEIERFRHDPDCLVLLANPAATSEGVSLHDACHDAIYLDRTFNAGQYLQSLDRIHRLGLRPDQQTRVTFIITDDTVDTVVDSRIRDKASRMSEILDDPSITTLALPDDDDYGYAVDTDEDLVALFAHLRGEDG